jgi:hypothetical protein
MRGRRRVGRPTRWSSWGKCVEGSSRQIRRAVTSRHDAEPLQAKRSIPAPDGTGAGASAGRLEADLQLLARACRNRHRDARRQVPFGAHTPVDIPVPAKQRP